MVRIYTCQACLENRHGECELGIPSPPGSIGGSKCFCPCTGDPSWNTPEKIEKDLKKLLESMDDYRKITKNINIGQY